MPGVRMQIKARIKSKLRLDMAYTNQTFFVSSFSFGVVSYYRCTWVYRLWVFVHHSGKKPSWPLNVFLYTYVSHKW